MKSWKGFLMVLAVVGCAGTAAAAPAIGVFFDENGSQQWAVLQGGNGVMHTAYVVAVGHDMLMGGMAFKLQLDPRIGIMGVEYPESIKLGEPQDGVQIGFNRCRPAWGGAPVVGAILTLWTGSQTMTNAQIRVVAHPQEGAVMVGDCDFELSVVDGLTSYLTISVDEDETSWGAVKGLYR